MILNHVKNYSRAAGKTFRRSNQLEGQRVACVEICWGKPWLTTLLGDPRDAATGVECKRVLMEGDYTRARQKINRQGLVRPEVVVRSVERDGAVNL